MAKIQLTQNIPVQDGRQFPYLGVTQLVGQFPINPSEGSRTASLKMCIQPYRIVMDGEIEVRIPHTGTSQCFTVEGFTLGDLPTGSIIQVAAALIAANIPAWSSAEVIE